MTKVASACLLFICFITAAFAADKSPIPQELKPWIPWVEKHYDFLECPVVMGGEPRDAAARLCAWPGKLSISLSRTRGEFEQNWQIYKEGFIPLPGNSAVWPVMVTVNNQPAMVMERSGKPYLWLAKGTAKVMGYWKWSAQPDYIAIPSISQFMTATFNGQPIFPENEKLYLAEQQQIEVEADSIEIWPFRLIADGHPMTSNLQLDLSVSGAARTINLGKVLLDGFKPIAIESELPAYWNTDGELIISARSGSWLISIDSFAADATTTLQLNNQTEQWPGQEIWSFAEAPQQRIATLEGLEVVDPDSVNVPPEWNQFPSFLYPSGEAAILNEKIRGIPASISNRLSLQRRMWLDFSGDNWTFDDTVTGEMRSQWRMDMLPPYQLERAQEHSDALLVTSLQPEQTGVELRIPSVQMTAGGTINAQSQLPVVGWQAEFESVNWRMSLPPANRLITALGAEYHNGWLSQWTIWDLFWLLLVVALCFHYGSKTLAAVSALTMSLMFHETGAPLVALSNLVLAFLLYQQQALSHKVWLWIKRVYLGLSLLAFVVAAGVFMVQQVRVMIHPQLEHYSPLGSSGYQRNQPFGLIGEPEAEVEEMVMAPPQAALEKLRDQREQKVVVTGSRIKRSEVLARYPENTVIQTGSGKPSWRWNDFSVRWDSPVTATQTTNLIIFGPVLMTLWRLLMLLGLVAAIYLLMVKQWPQQLQLKRLRNLAPVLLVAIVGSWTTPSQAEVPPKEVLRELADWLHPPRECAPSCATISGMRLLSEQVAGQEQVILELRVDALADVAIPLPQSKQWRLASIKVNNRFNNWTVSHQGKQWLQVKKGRQTIVLAGDVSKHNSVTWGFPLKPYNIQNLTSIWTLEGVQNGSLRGRELTLVKQPQAVAKQVERSGGEAVEQVAAIAPMVKVTRHFYFDNQWQLTTDVERIAPANGVINVAIPLLPFEKLLSSQENVVAGQFQVQLAAGESSVSWRSGIARADSLTLTASSAEQYVEEWVMTVAHQWRVETTGVVPVWPKNMSSESDDIWLMRYLPRPNESLELTFAAPAPVKGDSLAFDKVQLRVVPGKLRENLVLSAQYRSSRGGQSQLQLGAGEHLKAKLDQREAFLQLQEGVVDYTTSPGLHQIELNWSRAETLGMFASLPEINLNAPASNLVVQWQVPDDRWVIWTSGPVIGPAIIYWGELLAFIVIAILLSRSKFLPIKPASWLLLGLGLSLQSWLMLVWVTAWLIALEAHKRYQDKLGKDAFNLTQVFLALFSVISLLVLLASVPMSLLSRPDMGIVGNASSGYQLQWYLDQSSGQLPTISVISLPIWVYKSLMLAWALWLAFSIVGWIKWAWSVLNQASFFRSNEKSGTPQTSQSTEQNSTS
ncbi:MAG: hypothetical protein HWE11_05245 [Gammaproteobacteria bacterium]|nr:hypothetical protein [Gammaproteobacteria bacterium]